VGDTAVPEIAQEAATRLLAPTLRHLLHLLEDPEAAVPSDGACAGRLGDEPDLGHVTSRGPRQTQLDSFDLHANVWVPPNDRPRLEQLCRLCGAPHKPQYAEPPGPFRRAFMG